MLDRHIEGRTKNRFTLECTQNCPAASQSGSLAPGEQWTLDKSGCCQVYIKVNIENLIFGDRGVWGMYEVFFVAVSHIPLYETHIKLL